MPAKFEDFKHDLLTAIGNIETFIKGASLADYESNLMMRRAVEREFEIVGEILNRIERAYPNYFGQIQDGRAIINFRNLIAHGYDVINDERVYEIVQKNLPKLKTDVEQL